MFTYENGTLVIKKVDMPRPDFNIMTDTQDSYLWYLSRGIHDDMQLLQESLRKIPSLERLQLVVKVGDRVSRTYTKSQVSQGIYYYPVLGTFKLDGRVIVQNMELLRIPYMDDYGKVNIQGNSKVILAVQRPSEDISYDLKADMFNIAMAHANMRIYGTDKGIKLKYGKNSIPLDMLISAMLADIGDDSTHLTDVFRNFYIRNSLCVQDNTVNSLVLASLTSQYDIIEKIKSDQYSLGDTRNAINEMMNLSAALNCRLSRPVLNYPEDTVVTKSVLNDLVRHQINCIYVHNDEGLKGYRLAEPGAIPINFIPCGTRNCTLLKRAIPAFAHHEYIPEDVVLDGAQIIYIPEGVEITDEYAELFEVLKYKSIRVKAGTSSRVLEYSFEREVLGNYTARLGDLTDNIPDGRQADDWVYFYNNPTLEERDMDHLTPHDLMAIMSCIGQIKVSGKLTLLNRDTSFLKKVLLVGDILSETLQKTIPKFVEKYKANISQKLLYSTTGENPFIGLTKDWLHTLNEERFVAPTDAVNLIAEITQACRVNTMVKNAQSVVDEMRHLAMPFYGRLCPYETPAGKKLGLVNTRAIGAKVVNGMLKTPYRKVIATNSGKGIKISDKIVYMSVKEELGNKFGDILSLKKDENGNYLNTPIIAKIPNPEVSDDPFIFAVINAFDLAGGYVAAHPEQFISPTVALMPFACCNDAVRISYGANQVRQSIYLHNTQVPYVRTFMYEDMFRYSSEKVFKAPISGKISYLTNSRCTITPERGEDVCIEMLGHGHTGQLDGAMTLVAHKGDKIKKGDTIGYLHKYPQSFVVRAPFDGTISRITDGTIEIMRGSSGIVNLDDVETISYESGRIMGQSAVFTNLQVSVGDKVKKDQIIATTSISKRGIYSPSRNSLVAYVACGYNHEDGIATCEKAAVDYTSVIDHTLDYKVSKKKFSSVRANMLTDFKFCGPDSCIATIKVIGSGGHQEKTNLSVKTDYKTCGIPYEYSVIDETDTSRTFRYHLLGLNKLSKGDKMSGRHGNKGVVSYVYKNSEMPTLMNGKTIDFSLNPHGIPSRMNIGQLWECHCGLIAGVLGIELNSDPFNGASPEEIEYLMRYTWTLCNTPAIGEPGSGNYNRAAFNSVCAMFKKLPQELHEDVWKNIENILDWRGVFSPNGDATMYDPQTDTYYNSQITFGYSYMLKMMQESEEKICFRAGPMVEDYSRTTSQPMKGDHSNNGQRMGEMELVSLAAFGASAIIDEDLNEKSDNIAAQSNIHAKQLTGRNYDCKGESRAVDNLLYELEAVGVHLEVPKDIADISSAASMDKTSIDLRNLVQKEFGSDMSAGIYRSDDEDELGQICLDLLTKGGL